MRERQPHVTVAMITYNHEKFVGDAVRSILAQTYADFELVIVDDGSTDATAEVIRGLRDERIVYLRQENQGPSEARNTALRVARGTLIAQMSGDDVAEPARLERQVACHRDRPNSVIFSHCTFIGDDSRDVGSPDPNWPRGRDIHGRRHAAAVFRGPRRRVVRADYRVGGGRHWRRGRLSRPSARTTR